MQCANCEKDFKEDENIKGFVTNSSYHFGRPYREFGMMCPHCGFHNTVLSIPIRVPFLRTNTTYDKLDEIVESFRKAVEDFYKNKQRYKIQLDLYNEPEANEK